MLRPGRPGAGADGEGETDRAGSTGVPLSQRVGSESAAPGTVRRTGANIMISIQHWPVLIGLAVTIFLGFGVGPLIRHVGKSLPRKEPSPETTLQWERLTNLKTGGCWIGFFERLIFFAALWISGAWPILSSWLVFKLALYWQGVNVGAFPGSSPSAAEVDYLVAKRQIGVHHITKVLVGTGANIVLALIGVTVGRWIKLQ